MAFLDSETGFESTGGQLLLAIPPQVMSRREDQGPARAVAVSITGIPIVAELVRDQAQRWLDLRIPLLEAAEADTLEAIIDAGGVVTVKTTPLGPATIACAWGPREAQRFEPITGHYPDGKRDASGPADDNLRRYRVELRLVKLE